MQVVHTMYKQAFTAGETILHQGATVGEGDHMYLLESGEVDVVIAGGQLSSEAHKVWWLSSTGCSRGATLQ